MKKAGILFLLVSLFFAGEAQFLDLPTASKKASVMEEIGISEIRIDYFRPGVRGREGEIWGGVVPYNEGEPMPWRAGANDNTVINFEHDVKINGHSLEAGKYGIHIIPSETAWIVIFSNNYTSWGSFSYDPTEDALRIVVEPENCDHVEWLTYEFINQTDSSADIRLSWEKKMASFTVSLPVHEIVINSIRKELRNNIGFTWQGWQQAANYCLQNNIELEQGLEWINRSISGGFGAAANFTNLQTKSQILDALGRADEAEQALDRALELASMSELHFYGRSLIQQGDPKAAMEVFVLNRKRNPNDNFTTIVGLARGNMALGNMDEAAKYFRMAAEHAPEGQGSIYIALASQAEQNQ